MVSYPMCLLPDPQSVSLSELARYEQGGIRAFGIAAGCVVQTSRTIERRRHFLNYESVAVCYLLADLLIHGEDEVP